MRHRWSEELTGCYAYQDSTNLSAQGVPQGVPKLKGSMLHFDGGGVGEHLMKSLLTFLFILGTFTGGAF